LHSSGRSIAVIAACSILPEGYAARNESAG
jgi:hypothetical protein